MYKYKEGDKFRLNNNYSIYQISSANGIKEYILNEINAKKYEVVFDVFKDTTESIYFKYTIGDFQIKLSIQTKHIVPIATKSRIVR